ncbi:hypothetical protein AO377_1571 [Moraxella catarrhalis]|nr:hypothetical protein AO377_1571 [Moraxella catarrhalis]
MTTKLIYRYQVNLYGVGLGVSMMNNTVSIDPLFDWLV